MLVVSDDDGPGASRGGGDPDVVRGNRAAGPAQIYHDFCVVPAHLSVGGDLLYDGGHVLDIAIERLRDSCVIDRPRDASERRTGGGVAGIRLLVVECDVDAIPGRAGALPGR